MNSSHGGTPPRGPQHSSGPQMNTPPRGPQHNSGPQMNTPPRGPQQMFGTQDAIAKMYSSSPSGTRSQNYAGNQSHNQSANQSVPYNRNVVCNPKIPDRPHPGTSQTLSSYDTNSNVVKNVNQNNIMNSVNQINLPLQKDQQRIHMFSEDKNVMPPRFQSQNGMVNHSNGMHNSANRMLYAQSEGVSGNLKENNILQKSSYTADNFAINTYPYTTSNQVPTGSEINSHSQNTFYAQSDAHSFSAQSTADGKLGLQPTWQYVGNGRVPVSNRSETTAHGQRVIYSLLLF